MTAELQAACNEMVCCKQECLNLKARNSELESLLAIEIGESKALRDMVYNKDEWLESYMKQSLAQDEVIDTLKRAVVTKDRQLMLLVKERDRYKQELKTKCKHEKSAEFNKRDGNTTLSSIIHTSDILESSKIGSSGHESPIRSPQKLGNNTKTQNASADNLISQSPKFYASDDDIFDRRLKISVESSAREYKAIIRKLRSDLDIANDIISEFKRDRRKR